MLPGGFPKKSRIMVEVALISNINTKLEIIGEALFTKVTNRFQGRGSLLPWIMCEETWEGNSSTRCDRKLRVPTETNHEMTFTSTSAFNVQNL